MKKIYFLVLSLLVCMLTQTVNAVSFTLVLDDVAHVKVQNNYQAVSGLQSGTNNLTMDASAYLSIKANDGYRIDSVDKDGEALEIGWGGSYWFTPEEGAVYTVKSTDLAATKTATATITIDEPSNIYIYDGSGMTVSLTAGENTVSFDPTMEPTFTVYPNTVNTLAEFVKITVDGEEVSSSMGSYSIIAQDGSKINIVTLPDAVPTNVTFDFVNGDPACAVITVNNEPLELTGTTAEIIAGKRVSIMAANGYQINSVKVDGEEIYEDYYTRSYVVTIAKDCTISITATKLQTYAYVLKVDKAERIQAVLGTQTLEIVDGENNLTFVDSNNVLYVLANSGYKIKEVTGNGVAATPDYYGQYIVTLTENMVVNVVAEAIEKDATATITIDSVDKAFLFNENGYGAQIELTAGSNTIKFNAEAENPFVFYSTPAPYSVTLDGVALEPTYEGSNRYKFSLKDGSNLQILRNEPTGAGVMFKVDGPVDGLEVWNGDNQVTDIANELFVEEGTELEIFAKEGYAITSLKANGTAIEADEDGYFIVKVKEDTEIEVVVVAHPLVTFNVEGGNAVLLSVSEYDANGNMVNWSLDASKPVRVPVGHYLAVYVFTSGLEIQSLTSEDVEIEENNGTYTFFIINKPTIDINVILVELYNVVAEWTAVPDDPLGNWEGKIYILDKNGKKQPEVHVALDTELTLVAEPSKGYEFEYYYINGDENNKVEGDKVIAMKEYFEGYGGFMTVKGKFKKVDDGVDAIEALGCRYDADSQTLFTAGNLVSIYSMSGMKVLETNDETVSLATLRKGVYILKINNLTMKVVVK